MILIRDILKTKQHEKAENKMMEKLNKEKLSKETYCRR